MMRVLITGGAGFIGSNLAHHLLARGHDVLVLDNLSRQGVAQNLHWLQTQHTSGLTFQQADVRDPAQMAQAVQDRDVVFHLAAQVAVTTSVLAPRHDLEVNLLGAFNLLEAVRALPVSRRPQIIYTSTNKVYGRMEDAAIIDAVSHYAYRDLPHGADERRPLDFHSPYGCSKGAADQYMIDYARIYGLRTTVLRMSCIYGTRQFGTEDQGWVAHFLISAFKGQPITIFGDGKQVRDLLFIEDLIAAFLAVVERADTVAGQAFNIGGGPDYALSLLQMIDWIKTHTDRPVPHTFTAWRPGDQPVYISDIRKAKQLLGWQPTISVSAGLTRLWEWILAQRELFRERP
jgi:CDP-paratose 2-epimerase